MIEYIREFLANETLVLYTGLFSLVFFIITLVIIPWLILQIPGDYFSRPERHSLLTELNHPLLKVFLLIAKNLMGYLLILLGIALLVLPGQGLLTILLGIILIDFPGKYYLERWFVSRETILRSINWLRNKGNKAPIQL